jgi:enolase
VRSGKGDTHCDTVIHLVITLRCNAVSIGSQTRMHRMQHVNVSLHLHNQTQARVPYNPSPKNE